MANDKDFSVVKFDDGSICIAVDEKDMVLIPDNYVEPLIDALRSMMEIDEGFADIEESDIAAFEYIEPTSRLH